MASTKQKTDDGSSAETPTWSQARRLTDIDIDLTGVAMPLLRGSVPFVVTCLSTCAGSTFVYGLYLSCGMLYYVLQEHFKEENRLILAAPLIMLIGVGPIFSPILAGICRRHGCRIISITGGILTCLGILFTSFIENVFQTIISMGILISIGLSMMTVPIETAMENHIESERQEKILYAATTSAGFIGMTAMTGSINMDLHVHGWTRAFQILIAGAGIGTIVSLLYKPPGAATNDGQDDALTNQEPRTFQSYVLVNLLKKETFRLWMFVEAFSSTGMYLMMMHVILHAVECGVSQQKIVWLLPLVALSALVTIVSTCVAQTLYQIRPVLMLCSWQLYAVCFSTLWPRLLGSGVYVLTSVIFGMSLGGLTVMLPLILNSLVDIKQRSNGMAWARAARAVLSMTFLPIVVYLTSYFNTYDVAYYSATCCLGMSLILSLVLAKCVTTSSTRHSLMANGLHVRTFAPESGFIDVSDNDLPDDYVAGGMSRSRSQSMPAYCHYSEINPKITVSVFVESCRNGNNTVGEQVSPSSPTLCRDNETKAKVDSSIINHYERDGDPSNLQDGIDHPLLRKSDSSPCPRSHEVQPFYHTTDESVLYNGGTTDMASVLKSSTSHSKRRRSCQM